MKNLLLPLLALVLLVSCSAVRTTADYDTNTDFSQYSTFGFFKEGIDQAEISDLDKKRIMRAVQSGLEAKGMTVSSTPDLLVNLSTKTTERIDVNNYGWGFGWGPFWGNRGINNYNTTTEGTLFIDFIDSSKKELVWQGVGSAPLRRGPEAKTERINEIVMETLEQYPPQVKK